MFLENIKKLLLVLAINFERFINYIVGNFGIAVVVVIAFFIVMFLFFLVFFSVGRITRIIIKKKLKPLAEILHAEIKSSFIAGTYIRILNYGPEIRFRILLKGREYYSDLLIEILAPIGFKLKIIKKQFLDQSILGRGDEVKLNDGSIDKEYLIYYDKPDEASSYLTNSEHIEAIEYFLKNDFYEIEANKKGVHVSKTNYNLEEVSQEEVLTYLNNLSRLARM